MKKIYTFLLLIVIFFKCFDAIAQNYNGSFQELFFGWQANARAEAMGRGLSAVTGDALSFYYNPAGLASTEGLHLFGSFAAPYYLLDTADYNYFGASYKIKKYGAVGFSRDYFTYGYEVKITDEFGNITGSYEPHYTNYRLTLSSEVIKDLFVGLNLNLFQPRIGSGVLTVGNEKGSGNSDVFYADIGLIKSLNIKSKKLQHNFNFASSLINFNSAEYNQSQADKLPVIFRLGASYNLLIEDSGIISKLRSYNILVNLEYEDLFNSKFYGGFHSGLEFTFLEMLSLRGGFYTQKITDCENCKDNLSEFTYGFGLNIPVLKLSKGKVPLEAKFDFISLKQPSQIENRDNWNNFHVYTFRLSWIF